MQTSIEPTTTRADAIAMARDQLVLQRTELRYALEHRLGVAAKTRSDVSDGHGETEHLVVAEQQENDARIDAMTSASLADVEAALERIESGTYGRCVECDEEIPVERLEILPATPVCVRCQAQYERS